MNKMKVLLAIALAAFVAAPAFAETQNVKVSGSLDMYAFLRSNYDLQNKNDAGAQPVGSVYQGATHASSTANRQESDSFLFSITQLQVAANLTDNVSTVIDLINQRDWNNSANAWNGTGAVGAPQTVNTNEFDVLVDLAYVQMKEIFYSPLTLTIGRQNLVFGRGFIVGWNPQNPENTFEATEFTQIQSFDAIRATLDFSPWTLDFVYSNIKGGSQNASDDKDLYIAYLSYKFAEYNAVAEGYYTGEFDKNTFAGVTGSFDNSTDTLGGRVQFDPISQITLGAEAAYQFGEYRVLITDPKRSRDAWAVDIFGEYHWDNTWKPMVGLEYTYLSGENDLSSSSSSYGSWNGNYRLPVYGWIHDYLNVYYTSGSPSGQPSGQNQQAIELYGSIKPLSDLMLSAQYYHFWATDTMHATPAVPTTATVSDDLGDELDTLVTYNYTADVTFNFYADWFFPGNAYTSPFDAVASQYISEVKVTF